MFGLGDLDMKEKKPPILNDWLGQLNGVEIWSLVLTSGVINCCGANSLRALSPLELSPPVSRWWDWSSKDRLVEICT